MENRSKAGLKLIICALLVIVLFFSGGLFFRWREWKELEASAVSTSLPKVNIIVVEPEKEPIKLTLPGYFVAEHVTPLLARTTGYLKNFLVDIGDRVTEDQLLGEIDTPDIDAEWAKAKADLASLTAKKAIAKITTKRWSGLYTDDPESISKQEVDQKNAEYEAAVADWNAAKARVEHLEVLKNFKYILSPFSGIVVERNIDIGSLISLGNETMTQPYLTGFETVSQPLFKIAKIDTLRVFIEVPQNYYPFIKDGVEAVISVREYPDQVFKGVIERNAIALDQSSRTLLTQVNIDNRDNLLRPGLYAQVTFAFTPYRETFNIPISSLIIRDGPPYVALLAENDTIMLRQVEIGRDYGKSMQIVKGLQRGDRLVSNPNYRIKEGVKVIHK